MMIDLVAYELVVKYKGGSVENRKSCIKNRV